jgi:hypothetical protein
MGKPPWSTGGTGGLIFRILVNTLVCSRSRSRGGGGEDGIAYDLTTYLYWS